jgi:hypothetical protein
MMDEHRVVVLFGAMTVGLARIMWISTRKMCEKYDDGSQGRN